MVCKKDWVNFLIKKYFKDLFMEKEISVCFIILIYFMKNEAHDTSYKSVIEVNEKRNATTSRQKQLQKH